MNDREVILAALQRERDELHDKIMQVDRIIKKVKSVDYSEDNLLDNPMQLEIKEAASPVLAPVKTFSKSADIKVQILTVFEMIGKAAALKDIQHQYFQLTDKAYNIREVVRGLNRQGIVLMIRVKDSQRGVLWVKKDWVRNGCLLDQYKPEGFDLFYQATELLFE